MADFELPTPDITWDLNRLESVIPTEISSQPPSSAATLAPVTPIPVTSSTAKPTTATAAPVPPVENLVPVSPQANTSNESPTDRTFYSCSPLWSDTAVDENGKVATGNSPPSDLSTVRVAYYFQVQILGDDDIAMLLPTIESRFENSLGEYLTANSVYDESRCEGYFVEDIRRRSLNSAGIRTSAVERRTATSTKIVGISSATDLSVDETQPCIPRKEQCYIVHGELDATYVGSNEAGVKSSLSRVVKEELDGDSNYEIKYLGSQYQSDVNGANKPPAIDGVVANQQETTRESTSGGIFLSPIGIGILAVLGSTFFIACYVLFIKSDGAEKVKKAMEKREEKRMTKMAKMNALCEEDDEKRTDDQDYCYDLQSIAMDCDFDMDCEDGVEVHAMRSPDRVLHEAESTHDSEKTKKISNGTEDPVIFTFAYEDEESTACRQGNKSSSTPPASVNGSIPLVDRFPSARAGKSKSKARPPKSDESCVIHTLPPISESLSPPSNDTPHISHRPATRPGAPGRDETEGWEV